MNPEFSENQEAFFGGSAGIEFQDREFQLAIARAEDLEHPKTSFRKTLRDYGASQHPEIL